MNNDFFVAADLNLVQLEIEQLEREKRKKISAINIQEKVDKILRKKSDTVQLLEFDRLPKVEAVMVLVLVSKQAPTH